MTLYNKVLGIFNSLKDYIFKFLEIVDTTKEVSYRDTCFCFSNVNINLFTVNYWVDKFFLKMILQKLK